MCRGPSNVAMTAERTDARGAGRRWTEAEAESLLPAARQLLEVACHQTQSSTAHMTLVERPSGHLAHFAATPESRAIYKRVANLLGQGIALRAVAKKQSEFIDDIRQTREWQQAKR